MIRNRVRYKNSLNLIIITYSNHILTIQLLKQTHKKIYKKKTRKINCPNLTINFSKTILMIKTILKIPSKKILLDLIKKNKKMMINQATGKNTQTEKSQKPNKGETSPSKTPSLLLLL